jgi:hypothetical protein
MLYRKRWLPVGTEKAEVAEIWIDRQQGGDSTMASCGSALTREITSSTSGVILSDRLPSVNSSI